MNISLLNQILVYLVILSGTGIAFWCYLADRKAVMNKLFFSFVIVIISNIFFSYLFQLSPFNNHAILLARLMWATASLLIPIFYFFAIYFPSKVKSSVYGNIIFLALGIVFALLSISSTYLIRSVSTTHEIIYGSGINLFYAALLGSICTGFVIILKKYIHFGAEEKQRIKYFIFGIAIYLFLNIIFSIVLPIITGSNGYSFLGDYSAIFFLGFTAYAIMKHHLFNIKVIATEITVIMLSVALFVEVFLSNNSIEGAVKAIIWVLASYGGYILIKSVKTEIKQKETLEVLAKKLDEANKHLEELDEAKDNFLSMAAHELNTPIAAIEGYLSMIIDEKMAGELNPKAMEYLKNIYGSSKRLAGLVKDLLNVSRIESNRVHLIYTEEHIENIIDQSIAEVKIKADEVGHKLIFEKPKTALPKTWFDVDRITEVVINMIGNAVKYTEPPGKIVVSAHSDGDKIVIAIEDNGRGIPKDKYCHVFEKFVQVNVLTDQVKGTGLGMFISKNLIEMHKGKIWFKSSVDEKEHGTTFYFSLPILKDKPFDPHQGEGALFQTVQPKSECERPADQTGKTILSNDEKDGSKKVSMPPTENTKSQPESVEKSEKSVPNQERTANDKDGEQTPEKVEKPAEPTEAIKSKK